MPSKHILKRMIEIRDGIITDQVDALSSCYEDYAAIEEDYNTLADKHANLLLDIMRVKKEFTDCECPVQDIWSCGQVANILQRILDRTTAQNKENNKNEA